MVQIFNPNVVGKQILIDVKNIESASCTFNIDSFMPCLIGTI